MHHIQVFTCIYRSQSSSRLNINYATSGHGWVIESKFSTMAIGIEDGRQEIHEGKTPPRSCGGDQAQIEFSSARNQYTSKLPLPISSFEYAIESIRRSEKLHKTGSPEEAVTWYDDETTDQTQKCIFYAEFRFLLYDIYGGRQADERPPSSSSRNLFK